MFNNKRSNLNKILAKLKSINIYIKRRPTCAYTNIIEANENFVVSFNGHSPCTVLCCTVLYSTVLYMLYCTVLYMLHCTVLCCNVMYCTVLYCNVLYCTVLHMLYCRSLFCSIYSGDPCIHYILVTPVSTIFW